MVSHDFEIRGWKPDQTEKMMVAGRPHMIYAYRIGTNLTCQAEIAASQKRAADAPSALQLGLAALKIQQTAFYFHSIGVACQ